MGQSKEQFYDEEIAPKLLELGNSCKENGLSFIASVEWEPGECGRTQAFVKGFGHSMDWASAALQAEGNADRLIGYLVQRAKTQGHSSAYLTQLGVPHQPKDRP